MEALPFELPESLKSHVELYDTDAEKAILKLERHLKRRGYDAVGYMLLSWFYYRRGDKKQAANCAVRARVYATGSPFFDYLPYFLEHPDGLDAWRPHIPAFVSGSYDTIPENGIHVDLDHLIKRLSEAETKKIRLKKDNKDEKPEARLPVGDGIATETLAKIYESQEKYKQAIEVYEKISRRDPAKADHCREQIERLKELRENQE